MATFWLLAAFENWAAGAFGMAGRVIPLPTPFEGRQRPIYPVSGHSDRVRSAIICTDRRQKTIRREMRTR
nr:MAG TPA: hypothetical protein [Caudoviricetes sp.]